MGVNKCRSNYFTIFGSSVGCLRRLLKRKTRLFNVALAKHRQKVNIKNQSTETRVPPVGSDILKRKAYFREIVNLVFRYTDVLFSSELTHQLPVTVNTFITIIETNVFLTVLFTRFILLLLSLHVYI